MDPLGDAATDLHNSGFTLHEGATLAIRGSDSAIDGEMDNEHLTRNNNPTEEMEGNGDDAYEEIPGAAWRGAVIKMKERRRCLERQG